MEAMSARDDLFQQFGPFLTEALVYLLLDEINILRNNQGLPVITYNELVTKCSNHITELEPYTWMEGP